MVGLKTLIFAVIAIALAGIVVYDSLRGVSASGAYRYTADENPIGYALALTSKGLIFAFAVAEVLSGAGLIADPVVTLHTALPFLPTRRY